MCGIVGYLKLTPESADWSHQLPEATNAIASRGPDAQAYANMGNAGLGHVRLSILDVSEAGNQPMYAHNGRYTIVYNGEIFNFKKHREELIAAGVQLTSDTDTEVLLHMYINEGASFLNKLNGFFALAIYHKDKDELFIARDRIGIKPLHYYQDDSHLAFGSELKGLLKFPIKRELDQTTLRLYLQLTYIPHPYSMLKKVRRLEPGHYLQVTNGKVENHQYYEVERKPNLAFKNEETSFKAFQDLMDESVRMRMLSDVPLGAFLSGGIDSSVIVALASRYTDQLKTYSVGFADEPFFDETSYAELVAKQYKTDHTVFKLKNDDMFYNLFDMLNQIDEPFADSSSIAVNILCQQTRKHVTVALSGDGADELFGGYNKYYAEYRLRKGGLAVQGAKALAPIWKALPKSRNSKVTNLFRQLDKLATSAKLSPSERYWFMVSFLPQDQASKLLKNNLDSDAFSERKDFILRNLPDSSTSIYQMDDVLYSDLHLVLPNDMLTKVDLMSMSHGLEVRVPFLDHRIAEFAFSLPFDQKINDKLRKRIVQESFRSLLPEELFNRPKHGFEVPILKWFRNELNDLIMNDLLGDAFVQAQGIFELSEIQELKRKLMSSDPGDSATHIWTLIVFQHWWKRFLN